MFLKTDEHTHLTITCTYSEIWDLIWCIECDVISRAPHYANHPSQLKESQQKIDMHDFLCQISGRSDIHRNFKYELNKQIEDFKNDQTTTTP